MDSNMWSLIDYFDVWGNAEDGWEDARDQALKEATSGGKKAPGEAFDRAKAEEVVAETTVIIKMDRIYKIMILQNTYKQKRYKPCSFLSFICGFMKSLLFHYSILQKGKKVKQKPRRYRRGFFMDSFSGASPQSGTSSGTPPSLQDSMATSPGIVYLAASHALSVGILPVYAALQKSSMRNWCDAMWAFGRSLFL